MFIEGMVLQKYGLWNQEHLAGLEKMGQLLFIGVL